MALSAARVITLVGLLAMSHLALFALGRRYAARGLIAGWLCSAAVLLVIQVLLPIQRWSVAPVEVRRLLVWLAVAIVLGTGASVLSIRKSLLRYPERTLMPARAIARSVLAYCGGLFVGLVPVIVLDLRALLGG